MVREPLLHLDHAVGILQRGQVLHGIGELLPGAGVHVDGLLHQIHIQRHASVVYLLIETILTPDFFRDRELGQPILDGLFDLHVPAVIAFEGGPLVRRVHRQVPGPATVGLRRRTGLAEVFDEVLALRELLLVQPQHGTDAFQGERQAHRGGPDHGAVPSCRVQIVADRILRNAVAGIVEAAVVPEPARQADALKLCVEGPLDHGVIRQRGDDLRRQLLAGGKVHDLHRSAVHGVAKQQNVKVRSLGILVDSAFAQVVAAVGFDINTECFHNRWSFPKTNRVAGLLPPPVGL